MTALEYFRLFAPEFASVADAIVNKWIAIAEQLANVSCLNDERKAIALALYAAHRLALTQATASSGSSSGTGALKREKEGDLEREYVVFGNAQSFTGQTSYGQQYLDITSACAGVAIITRGSRGSC